LATLAHELRNPLAPIRHAVKLLESSEIGAQHQQWAREVITRQMQRMALRITVKDDGIGLAREVIPNSISHVLPGGLGH
jgi:nitrogen-specific signal transduction histidine kinase